MCVCVTRLSVCLMCVCNKLNIVYVRCRRNAIYQIQNQPNKLSIFLKYPHNIQSGQSHVYVSATDISQVALTMAIRPHKEEAIKAFLSIYK